MIAKTGLLLALLVVLWTFVMGYTGWYKHPTLLNLFFLVIPIQIGVLIWGLNKTAAEGRSYWGQVKAGISISVIAAVLIFCGSLLFTMVVFPNYFVELRAMNAELLRTQGVPEAQIPAEVEKASAGQTPLIQAAAGAVGTIVTGLAVSLVVSVFCRKAG